MTTPSGQHHTAPNGAANQATSTVLALDGWGAVAPEPPVNGTNGSDPEAAVAPEPMLEAQPPQSGWRTSIRAPWAGQLPRPAVDPRLLDILAPAAAMVIAVAAAVRVGTSWREGSWSSWSVPRVPAPEPEPPNQWMALRRRLALAIDPSLTPVEPQRKSLRDRLPDRLTW